jgi:hypothetical protein
MRKLKKTRQLKKMRKSNRTKRSNRTKCAKRTGGNNDLQTPDVNLEVQQDAIKEAVAIYFPEYIFEIKSDPVYIYTHENGNNYPLYNIVATKEQSDKENRNCFSFWAFERTIYIYTIDRCVKNVSTKDNISKFIEMVKSITTPKYQRIEIGDDQSTLWFECPTKDTIKNRKIRISLAQMYLLQYGQTYYNSFGFGRQSEQWSQFIQQPIHSFLESIQFFDSTTAHSYPNHVASIPIDNTTISEYFKSCMNRIRHQNYCVDGFIYYMGSILWYIFNKYKQHLPALNNDLTLVL